MSSQGYYKSLYTGGILVYSGHTAGAQTVGIPKVFCVILARSPEGAGFCWLTQNAPLLQLLGLAL